MVLLDDTARTNSLVSQIQKHLTGKKLEVVAWSQLADFYNKTVVLFSKQVNVMKFIIAIIIVFEYLQHSNDECNGENQ